MPLRVDAFQLAVGDSDRLCIWRAPLHGQLRGRVIHVPAFAEEMNKCRSMVAEASRRLAEQGFGVLEIDLLGCGDSAGDFHDASFEAWIEDIRAGIAWTDTEGGSPLWLWAMRGGAPLAAGVAEAERSVSGMLLWQPVISGRMHLTQFLRIKLASDAIAQGNAGAGTRLLREALQRGQSVEVAGYELSPALASALDASAFTCPEHVTSVLWLEVGTGPSPMLGAASEAAIAAIRVPGRQVEVRAVPGPPFWQTVEIERAPALVDMTLSLMTEAARDALR